MLEKIQSLIAEQTGLDVENIKAESSFKEDLEIDSLDLFEMIMSLEDEFGVEIPNEDLEKITTVQQLMDYLKGKGVEE